MYSYEWDSSTGGYVLIPTPLSFSKEPRPVYYKELDLLGFDRHWKYEKNDSYPYLWAEANNYFYRGRLVAKTKGGTLFSAPEIILIEDPEPEGYFLRFVDIPAMVKKNVSIMAQLEQETIKKIYNTFVDFKKRVDVFHVSYSGGKDSDVLLDLVQRTLPHNEFIVLFGDTGMEFPDTYQVVDEVEQACKEREIAFYRAKAPFTPLESWNQFGYPSSALRWCCSVHKSVPQLLTLRQITSKPKLKEMAFVGVRASESLRRSQYEYVSNGMKHSGQYSCNPILEWNSAEIYLYIYEHNLPLNGAYKKGGSRAGCLLCPMATNKSDYINYAVYPKEVQPYIDIIKKQYICDNVETYLDNKGWNARKNGRDLNLQINGYSEKDDGNKLVIESTQNDNNWKQWLKTAGKIIESDNKVTVVTKDESIIEFTVQRLSNGKTQFIFDSDIQSKKVKQFKGIRYAIRKGHSCINCGYCVANCPFGNISINNGIVNISDACVQCGSCNELDHGCLVYNSLVKPKGTGKMKSSIDEYGTHPVCMDWMNQFVSMKENFDKDHHLGSAMYPMFKKFLRNAGILNSDNTWNKLTEMVFEYDLDSTTLWALLFSNLAYSSEVGWLVKNIGFNQTYSQLAIKNMLEDYITSKTGPSNIANCYRRMSELPLSNVGFGLVDGKTEDGFSFIRIPWNNPDERVILYSLYKFAEACGDYRQFTLTRLMDHSVDSTGISPSQIFGLNRETMEKILNGLTFNYPDLIEARFTLGLDSITLKSEENAGSILSMLF